MTNSKINGWRGWAAVGIAIVSGSIGAVIVKMSEQEYTPSFKIDELERRLRTTELQLSKVDPDKLTDRLTNVELKQTIANEQREAMLRNQDAADHQRAAIVTLLEKLSSAKQIKPE